MNAIQNIKIPDKCRLFLVYLHRLEDMLLMLVLSGMILLATLQIIMRNLFDSGLIWADSLLRVLVLWLALLGAMVAARADKHIRIDLLSRVLPGNLAAAANIVVNIFTSMVAAFVAWHAWRFVRFDYENNVMAFATVPAWVTELIIPLVFVVIALRFLFMAFSQAVGLLQSRPAA